MHRHHAVFGALLIVTSLATTAGALGAPRGDGDTLDARICALLPTPEEERWLEVPWRLDLLAARAESAATGKPIYLWLMNGDPCGCT